MRRLGQVETAGKTLPPEQQLPRLCGVRMRYTDSAAAVGWRRVREDTSLVTVLHGVGECAGVEESLARLCAEEAIDDYDTEQHGRQTVVRRCLFHVPRPGPLLPTARPPDAARSCVTGACGARDAGGVTLGSRCGRCWRAVPRCRRRRWRP